MENNSISPYCFVLITILLCFQMHSKADAHTPYMEIPVGVILDMGSWVGKSVFSCINIAVSEFYALNTHYKTRIVLHHRDTHGEPRHALSAALDLLEKSKVQALLGSQSIAEAKFLAVLGEQAEIPILSLSPIPYTNTHPYFIQITQDETTQVKAIASMASSFGWKDVIVIFEDTEDGREMATYMTTSLQEKSISITYMSPISTSSSNEVLREELHKLRIMQTKLFILLTSHPLAFHLLKNAKYLGMMDAGYKWIVTSKTMNFLDFRDDEVIESMQGVVGFKSFIPQSKDLHKLRLRWRKEYHVMEHEDISTYAIAACDGIIALAMAIEKTQSVLRLNVTDTTPWGTTLLNQMLRISFDGLSGNFKILDARVITRVLEMVNVIGKEEVKVGFWTTDAGFTKMIGKLTYFPEDVLETIVWPGGVVHNPMHRMLQVRSARLRIGIPKRRRIGPLFELVTYDVETNSTLVSGFCSEVFLTAFGRLDPNAAFEFIQFDGSYDDLIYQVKAGEFDAAIGDITFTAKRSQYVDFTLPYTELGLATLYRNVDATTSLWIFLKPLSSDLWLVSACFFVLLGFVIWVLEHETNDEFQGSLVQQIGATLWFAFSTLVYAQRQKLESNLSRFVVTVWLFVVLVLVSSYTAALSSLLTVEQIQILSDRGIIGYQGGSLTRVLLIRKWKFNDARLKPYNTLEEIADALSLGSKKGGVDAIVDEIPYIKEFLARYPSGYSMITSEDYTNGFSFVFPKGSPLTLGMSTQIAGLREDGTLQKLDNKWFGQQSDQQSNDAAHALKILNFKGMRGLFLLSGITMSTALFIFTIYYIHDKLHYTYAMLAGGKLVFILRYFVPKRAIDI